MQNFLINSVISAVLFGVMDTLWFSVFMKKFAISRISSHMNLKGSEISIHYPSLIIAYGLMVLISSSFLVPKLRNLESWQSAFLEGSLMGVCIFGIFDFTNKTLMKDYPLDFALVDTLWGGLMFSILSCILWKFGYTG